MFMNLSSNQWLYPYSSESTKYNIFFLIKFCLYYKIKKQIEREKKCCLVLDAKFLCLKKIKLLSSKYDILNEINIVLKKKHVSIFVLKNIFMKIIFRNSKINLRGIDIFLLFLIWSVFFFYVNKNRNCFVIYFLFVILKTSKTRRKYFY
jgi:hypothetical protein